MKKLLSLLFVFLILIGFFAFLNLKNPPNQIQKKIQGVVVPHHGLAKDLLTNTFERLKSNSNPKYIVIYGTNHYYPVSETYTTTQDVKSLYKLTNVIADDKKVDGDHSIGTIIPYLKNYFPDAKVVPILVSARYKSIEELNTDAKIFTQAFGSENTLYIASVDFAHDVSLSEGLANNIKSIDAIKNFDYQEILKFRDDHMDSPTAISTLLMSMQNIKADNWETWYSSHGGLILGSPDAKGTSYVAGIFF